MLLSLHGRVFAALALVGVLYFIFLGGSLFIGASLWPHVAHQAIVTAMFGLWLLTLWRSRRSLPATPLDRPLLAYVVVLLLSACAALYPRVSLEQTWTPLTHVLGFYLLVDLMQRGWGRWMFAGLFVAGALVIALSGVELVTWYFGLPPASDSLIAWPAVGRGLLPPVLPRLDLATTNPNLTANLVAILLPVTAAWTLTTVRRRLRIGGWLLVAGLIAVLLLTQSRGGWLSAAASAVCLAGFWWRQRTSGRLRSLMRPAMLWPLAGLGTLMVVAGGYLFVRIFIGRGSSDLGRLDLWRNAIEMARDHPTLGVGPSMYGTALVTYRVPQLVLTLQPFDKAHNLILNVSAETGAAGVIVLAWIAIAGLRIWWQQWQSADFTKRRRLEGCLAAFVGFSIHSMVDTFSPTTMVLPLLIYAAYITAEARAQADLPAARRSGRWRLAFAGVLLVSYAVAFVPVDTAMFSMWRASADLGAHQPAAALDSIDRAIAIDPAQDIYREYRAYILGLLADTDPSVYLDAAIAAHESITVHRPDYEVMFANLGALYAQRGDVLAAVSALERATALHPKEPLLWLALGMYRESAGDREGALEAYIEGLQLRPVLVDSRFWAEPGAHPARARAFDAALRESEPAKALAFAVAAHDIVAAQTILADAPALYEDAPALAGQYLYQTGRCDDAVPRLETALQKQPSDSDLYRVRAECFAALDNWDDAIHDAKTALFIDAGGARSANDVLAQAAFRRGNEGEAETRLMNSVGLRATQQYYAITHYGSAFGKLARFDYLPQLRVPRRDEASLEPWLELAQHYSDTGRPDRAIRLYERIAQVEPYLAPEMIGRIAALTLPP